MLILSNCLTEIADEGCLKVANSLVKRIIKESPDTTVVSYERKPKFETTHLSLNKLLISKELYSLIRKSKESVLYIPFPAKEWATAIRVFLLSCVCRKKVTILLTMLCKCGFFGRFLFRISGANIITLSQSTVDIYEKTVGKKRVKYLKTGVDTARFSPVSEEKKKQLREKYGFYTEKKIILHTGHLKEGRNIAQLMKFDLEYQIVLVVSTLTQNEQDKALKNKLLQTPNVRLIYDYQPNIEELYQLSDVYFFPVLSEGNCIDVPLSCLEAASCNIPVVTTSYGEMSTFKGKDGFWFIDSFDREYLNNTISVAIAKNSYCTRQHVMEYDWNKALEYIKSLE